jgi:hypothetical protein
VPIRVTAGSPEAILAIVPNLLGFYPDHSLVVLGLSSRKGRVELTFRYDLPDPPDSELAADIAGHAATVLGRQRLRAAVLVAYGPAGLAAPVLAAVMDCLLSASVGLRDVLRAEGGRYWSMLCADEDCCPREGRPFDPGSHPAAAAMSAAGLPAMPDRAALARTLLPPAASSQAIRHATWLAEQRLLDLGAKYCANGGSDPQDLTARTGRSAVQRAIRQYRAGGSVSGDELAWLAVLLADLRVRDDAWARLDPRHRDAHARLWTDVVRAAGSDYVAAPASLLAFTAWQAGNGGLAAVAVERALAARPGYSMALLIGSALQAGLPPSAARLPMTPAEVAASYAATQVPETARPAGAGGSGDRQSVSARSRTAGGRSRPAGDQRSGSATSGASSRPSA